MKRYAFRMPRYSVPRSGRLRPDGRPWRIPAPLALSIWLAATLAPSSVHRVWGCQSWALSSCVPHRGRTGLSAKVRSTLLKRVRIRSNVRQFDQVLVLQTSDRFDERWIVEQRTQSHRLEPRGLCTQACRGGNVEDAQSSAQLVFRSEPRLRPEIIDFGEGGVQRAARPLFHDTKADLRLDRFRRRARLRVEEERATNGPLSLLVRSKDAHAVPRSLLFRER